jgi:hypothetical protein
MDRALTSTRHIIINATSDLLLSDALEMRPSFNNVALLLAGR